MANIRTFADFHRDSDSDNTPPGRGAPAGNNAGYAPLDFARSSQPASNSNKIISFGYPTGPGGEEGPQVNPMELFFPGFGFETFVFITTMMQILVFIITEIIPYTMKDSGKDAFNCVLYRFGGKFTPAIVTFHDIHRLFLPIFLHAGIGHIFFNMLSQWFYGFKLEQVYGAKKFALLYFVAGIGGNLLSAINSTANISVGASSALFGIFALQLAYLIENYDNLGPRRNLLIVIMVILIIANLGNATQNEKIDNSAHLGGFLVGALMSVLYINRPSDPGFHKKKKIAGAVLIAYFVICSIILARMTGFEKAAEGYVSFCEEQFAS